MINTYKAKLMNRVDANLSARAKMNDLVDRQTLDDSSSVWKNEVYNLAYDRFCSIVNSRNPHYIELKKDIPSKYNEALILFLVAEGYGIYNNDQHSRKMSDDARILCDHLLNTFCHIQTTVKSIRSVG